MWRTAYVQKQGRQDAAFPVRAAAGKTSREPAGAQPDPAGRDLLEQQSYCIEAINFYSKRL